MGHRIESRLPTQERLDQFLSLIRAGNYVNVACGYTGISESAIYAWGQEARQPDPRPKVAEFVEALKEAQAFSEAAALQVVHRAANNGVWQAAAWFLERRAPRRWGRFDRHEVEVSSAAPGTSVREQLARSLEQLGEDLIAMDEDVIEVGVIEPVPPLRLTPPPEAM